MYPCKKEDKLPTLSFCAGATKNFYFPVTNKTGDEVDATGCSARLSVINCTNRSGKPVIQKDAHLIDGASSVFKFTLDPDDTINLKGKFIYQIWIKDSKGIPEEPQQGELYITQNIDKSFI